MSVGIFLQILIPFKVTLLLISILIGAKKKSFSCPGKHTSFDLNKVCNDVIKNFNY